MLFFIYLQLHDMQNKMLLYMYTQGGGYTARLFLVMLHQSSPKIDMILTRWISMEATLNPHAGVYLIFRDIK